MATQTDERYKSHFIHAIAGLEPDTKCWAPVAHISWDKHGARQFHLLKGPLDRFKNPEEVESYAIAMARRWIDDGKPSE